MKGNTILTIAVIAILIGVGAYYGVSNLSVIDEREVTEWPEATCNVDADCIQWALDQGISQAELDESLKTSDVYCGNQNYCLARSK